MTVVQEHWRRLPSILRCPSSEYSILSLSSCNESSYLKTYRDDKQKTSTSYSLSTVEGIQQVSRSRQYSRRWTDAEHE